jgi:hypothetical protein
MSGFVQKNSHMRSQDIRFKTPKMMMVIAWNPLGFHLLDSLPKCRTTFNAEYYRDNILSALPPLRPQAHGRKLIIHAANASPEMSHKYTPF